MTRLLPTLASEGESVRVLDLAVERAVASSLRAARETRSRGPGPWLRVRGTPPDVELAIDGARVGESPSRSSRAVLSMGDAWGDAR